MEGQQLGGDVPYWTGSENTRCRVCGWQVCNMIFTCWRKPPWEGDRCTAPAAGRALWLGAHPAPISQAARTAHLLCSTSLGFFEYRHSCNIPLHGGSSRSPHQSCGCLAHEGTGVTGGGGSGAGADPNKDGREARGDDVGAGSDKSEKHTHTETELEAVTPSSLEATLLWVHFSCLEVTD